MHVWLMTNMRKFPLAKQNVLMYASSRPARRCVCQMFSCHCKKIYPGNVLQEPSQA